MKLTKAMLNARLSHKNLEVVSQARIYGGCIKIVEKGQSYFETDGIFRCLSLREAEAWIHGFCKNGEA